VHVVDDDQPAGDQLGDLVEELLRPLSGVDDDDPSGRSSLRESSLLVWIRDAAPNPSMPRNTLAPASPR
jgi:hypothetical protein